MIRGVYRRSVNGGHSEIPPFIRAELDDVCWLTGASHAFNGRRSLDGHSSHWRMIMEMPQAEPAATKRQVWNAGRTVGAKRALKLT